MIANRGLRHLALNVEDVERARDFYAKLFGMRVVWQPDPDNVYLTSGCDNLALHRGTGRFAPDNAASASHAAQPLHHLGFIVPSVAELEAGFAWVEQNNVSIVHPLRHHRDGSVSFYIRDPDGNVIQLLFEPSLSSMSFAANSPQE